METLREELRNVKTLILETTIPPANEIKVTVSKPGPLNANFKLVMVTQPVSVTNLILITKSKKLPNPLIFDRN